MSLTLSRLCWGSIHFIDKPYIRHRWIRRGKPPEKAKSLAQRMTEWNWRDPELHYRINIGFSYSQPSRKDVLQDRLNIRKSTKENLEMEKAAKHQTLKIPVDGVHEECLKTNRPFHLQEIAEYFNVYQDLLGDAFFVPVTPLDIRFRYPTKDGEVESPVFCGNQITPFEAVNCPRVTYPAKKDTLYTLALTTPDCHLLEESSEYLHWLVGNIPESSIDKGHTLCDYIRPFPFKGVGFCRYVFILYIQNKTLDFSKYQRSPSCTNLTERTFSSYDFYRDFQDFMTPAGLSFFQSNWDQSLTDFFHNVLDMQEPCFEYDFKPAELKPQQWFPKGKPFNLYMDKYKDPKLLQKELLVEKLKERHPFRPPPTPPKYPLAHRFPHSNTSWLNDDIRRKRMREGKWKFM